MFLWNDLNKLLEVKIHFVVIKSIEANHKLRPRINVVDIYKMSSYLQK